MAAPAAVLSKTCSKCGESKPLSEFRARKDSRDGLHGWCHPCYNGYYSKASREWRAANREQHRDNERRRYAAQPELGRASSRRWSEKNREAVRVAARQYYAANREVRVQFARQYREENRDLIRARQRARHAANPAVYRARAERRYSVERATRADVIEWITTLLTQPCAYCGATEAIEIDHVIPVVRGGTHTRENLAPACMPCNRSKGSKLLSEWGGRR